jgi:hypothetical protein
MTGCGLPCGDLDGLVVRRMTSSRAGSRSVSPDMSTPTSYSSRTAIIVKSRAICTSMPFSSGLEAG